MACLTVKRTRDSDPTVWMHQPEWITSEPPYGPRQDIYRVVWPPEPLGAAEQHARLAGRRMGDMWLDTDYKRA